MDNVTMPSVVISWKPVGWVQLFEGNQTIILACITSLLAVFAVWANGRGSKTERDLVTESETRGGGDYLVEEKVGEAVGSQGWVEVRWKAHKDAYRKDWKKGVSQELKGGEDLYERINSLCAENKIVQAGELLMSWEVQEPKYITNHKQILPMYTQIKQRYTFSREFTQRLRDNDSWTLSSNDEKNNRKVWYKKGGSSNLLVKVECDFCHCDLVHVLAHAKEAHTCPSWIPFTRFAAKVVDVKGDDGIELVVHACIGIPGISRDALIHFWTNDSLDEQGKYYLFNNSVGEGQGIYDWHKSLFKGLASPPSPMAPRVSIKYTAVELTVNSRDHMNIQFLAEIDPKIKMIPISLINFALRKIVAVAVGMVEGICRKMRIKQQSTEVGRIMDENKQFYDKLHAQMAQIYAKFDAEQSGRGKVVGWALKDIVGSNMKRKKRRFFKGTYGSNVLRYFGSERIAMISGRKEEGKKILVADALLGGGSGVDARTVIISQFKDNDEHGLTRLVSLAFDDAVTAKKFVEALVEGKEASISPKRRHTIK